MKNKKVYFYDKLILARRAGNENRLNPRFFEGLEKRKREELILGKG